MTRLAAPLPASAVCRWCGGAHSIHECPAVVAAFTPLAGHKQPHFCKWDGCLRHAKYHGLCGAHASHAAKRALVPPPPRCTIKGCGKPSWDGTGRCNGHRIVRQPQPQKNFHAHSKPAQ